MDKESAIFIIETFDEIAETMNKIRVSPKEVPPEEIDALEYNIRILEDMLRIFRFNRDGRS